MFTKITTMKALEAKSIRISKGMMVYADEGKIDLTEHAERYNNCYAFGTGTICFVSHNEVFVTDTLNLHSVESILRSAGFNRFPLIFCCDQAYARRYLKARRKMEAKSKCIAINKDKEDCCYAYRDDKVRFTLHKKTFELPRRVFDKNRIAFIGFKRVPFECCGR